MVDTRISGRETSNSKHTTTSTCSLAMLKNLFTSSTAGLFMMLSARKVKNLLADLEEKLSEEEEESQNSVSSSQSRNLLLSIQLAQVHHL